MNSATTTPVLLAPITEEEIERFELYLPTVNVISYAGPGVTGGVPASLEPVVRRLGTRVNWFALSELPQANTNFAPPSKGTAGGGFSYYAPLAPKRLFDAHQKVVNGYLWDLLHGFINKSVFDPEAWKSFRALCQSVASECITTASESFPTICWLHDYQLALAAPVLASQHGIVLSQFWHAPWPQPEIMVNAPIGRELVQAMLHNKLIGFHTEEYAENFLLTAAVVLEDAAVDLKNSKITYKGRTTTVSVLPLGVDMPYWQEMAAQSKPYSEALAEKLGLASQFILGVERLEYTKGILERLNGLELMLKTNPSEHRRFHYVQISQEAKLDGTAQLEYARLVEAKIASINKEYGREGWVPIIHLKGKLDHQQLAAWYQAATALSINSISDGINVIAKEFVACRNDQQGVLILSKAAGCARELAQGAYLVDPKSPVDISNAFKAALSINSEEKRRRMTSMRDVLTWNQLHNWALSFLRLAMAK
ncbi:MAG: trehalose-6-phosphate synthase [Candidatus Obscuribacterales bacterium]|jgi:trehalose 6-phosphate synthase